MSNDLAESVQILRAKVLHIILFLVKISVTLLGFLCRFTLPPFLTLKNFEGLDLGKMDEVCGNQNCLIITLT